MLTELKERFESVHDHLVAVTHKHKPSGDALSGVDVMTIVA